MNYSFKGRPDPLRMIRENPTANVIFFKVEDWLFGLYKTTDPNECWESMHIGLVDRVWHKIVTSGGHDIALPKGWLASWAKTPATKSTMLAYGQKLNKRLEDAKLPTVEVETLP